MFFFLVVDNFLGHAAITRLKEEKVRCVEMQDRPEIEEFIPLKANSGENGQLTMEKDSCDKKNWMSSAQLWSTETKSVILKFSFKISY